MLLAEAWVARQRRLLLLAAFPVTPRSPQAFLRAKQLPTGRGHPSPPVSLSPALLPGGPLSRCLPAMMSDQHLLLSRFLRFHSITSIFIHSLPCAALCARHQGAQKKWIFHQPIKRREVPAFALLFFSSLSLISSEQPQKQLPEPRLSPLCYSAPEPGLSFPQAAAAGGPVASR